MSFPLGEDGVYDTNLDTGAKLLGDIVISVPKAMEQAVEYNHSVQREMGFLTVFFDDEKRELDELIY